MDLKDIVIVLCRPKESGNVGSVCRAMKNMGLSNLRLVREAPLDEAGILSRAVHAKDIWEGARFFENLESAVADCALVIGVTRRRGKKRKSSSLEVRECANFLKNYPAGAGAALVFGNERTGLENSELSLCSLSSHIMSSDAFPSLNLSAAAQIYCYELFAATREAPPAPPSSKNAPAPRETIDDTVRLISSSLEKARFYTHSGERGKSLHKEFFTGIFSRAALTKTELSYIRGIFARLCAQAGGLAPPLPPR